ncbi:MAG TPA: sensor histidine kinase [Solirubrobacteraceae bacterium]
MSARLQHMGNSRVALWSVALAGTLAAIAAVKLSANPPAGRPTEPGPALEFLVGAALFGCGLASWRTRPENRLGPAMVVIGFAWFAEELNNATTPWLNTLGIGVQSYWIAGMLYLLLSFPSGRLTRLERRLLGVALAVVSLQLVALLVGSRAGLWCSGCERNVVQLFHDNGLALGLLKFERLVGLILVGFTIVLLIRRWLRAGAARRRAIAPVVVAGCLTLAALGWAVVFDLLGDPLGSLPSTVFRWLFATVPIAVLYVFLQRRLSRGKVAGLVVELGEPSTSMELGKALARALGDPSLELAFWFPAERRYVDGEGGFVNLPEPGTQRSATFVERDGQPIAVLIHDPVLEHNAELVRSVCAAASLALENERLQAELRARLVELQGSRSRLVEATDSERRRIERDLHDGTQQRLVQIAMSLGLLERKLPNDIAGAQPLVRETRQALAVALEELRELTHGINPPLLVERGLPAALDELCRKAALPSRLDSSIDRRLPDQVETAAYFLASEALANAAKHSHGSQVRVTVVDEDRRLVIEITDDGIGAATTAGGSGLRGLADRVEALGGSFTITSPPGRGTTLRAEIPCG